MQKNLTKTARKLKNWNNLLIKLAGSTWGTSTNTLWSSALALCYSAAEYCAPVWLCSAHISQVDVQLNSAMHLISGTLRSTPLPWLPVLSNIEPLALQRKAATDKLVEKIVKHDSWPIQPDILSSPLLRLTSRKPLWLDLQPLDIKSQWRHNWKSAQVVNSHLVCDPTIGNRVSTSLVNTGLCWTVFARTRDTAVPAKGNGDLQTLICVLVVRPRRCPTLSNPVLWQNWMAANLGYTLQMKTLFRGWPVMVHAMHTRRKRSVSRFGGDVLTTPSHARSVDSSPLSQILAQNRDFCLPHLHSLFKRRPSEYCHAVWYGKTRMAWLSDGENF